MTLKRLRDDLNKLASSDFDNIEVIFSPRYSDTKDADIISGIGYAKNFTCVILFGQKAAEEILGKKIDKNSEIE